MIHKQGHPPPICCSLARALLSGVQEYWAAGTIGCRNEVFHNRAECIAFIINPVFTIIKYLQAPTGWPFCA